MAWECRGKTGICGDLEMMTVRNARLEMFTRKMLVVLIGLFVCSIALPSLAQRQLSPWRIWQWHWENWPG